MIEGKDASQDEGKSKELQNNKEELDQIASVAEGGDISSRLLEQLAESSTAEELQEKETASFCIKRPLLIKKTTDETDVTTSTIKRADIVKKVMLQGKSKSVSSVNA